MSIVDQIPLRAPAARERAEWLLAVASGVLEISELLETAINDPESVIHKITLRELLLSQEGWGKGRTKRILDSVRDTLGVDIPIRSMTVGWLLSRKEVGASRFLAWIDAFDPRTSAPWVGFPFAPRPENS